MAPISLFHQVAARSSGIKNGTIIQVEGAVGIGLELTGDVEAKGFFTSCELAVR